MLRHNCRFLLAHHLFNLYNLAKISMESRSCCTIEFFWLLLLPNVFIWYQWRSKCWKRKAASKYLREICKANTLCRRRRSFQTDSIVLFLMCSNNFLWLWINDRKNFTFFLNQQQHTGFLFWFGHGCSFSGVGSNKKLSGYCLLERA